MSLIWRRVTIAGLLCTAIAAIAAVVLTPVELRLQIAWTGFAAFLGLATIAWYDGRRMSHALLFSIGAALLGASVAVGPFSVAVVASAVSAAVAVVAAGIAFATRERDEAPTLARFYAAAVKARRIRSSDEQLAVVARLDALVAQFRVFERRRRLPWAFLLSPPKGVYLHGAAGRGKSFLLDGMFDSSASRSKRRYHFHELMAAITRELHREQGRQRASGRVARTLAPRGSLVLVDEINVIDQGSAALFAPVLEAWWRMGLRGLYEFEPTGRLAVRRAVGTFATVRAVRRAH